MNDDVEGWTEADDAQFRFAALPFEHPVSICRALVEGLDDPEQFRAILTELVTPESLEQWADFTEAASLFGSFPDFVFGIKARYMTGAPDVRYVAVYEHPGAGGQLQPEQTPVYGFFSVVWRPELAGPLGGWKVHNFAREPTDPTTLPRTSPGEAPTL